MSRWIWTSRVEPSLFPYLVIWFTLLTSGVSCVTTRNAHVAQANSKLAHWNEQFKEFASEADALIQEIALLRNHPGWPEMEEIIRAAPSIEYVEGQAVAEKKTTAAIGEWSKKWSAPGQKMLTKYLELAERSRALESRRSLLDQERGLVYAEWVAAVAEASILSELGETPMMLLHRMKSSVDRYGVDSLGLYIKKAS